MITVANCYDIHEAFRLQMALGAADIPSLIPDETTAQNVPYFFIGSSAGIRLQVAEEHASEAQRIISKLAKCQTFLKFPTTKGARKMKRKSNVSRSDQGIQRMRYLVLSFVIVAASPFAHAEENAVQSYLLPEHGTFQVKVPESWKDSVAQPTGGLPPTITFTAKAGAAFKILLTPVWSAQPDLKTPTPDELKIRVQRSADEMTQHAVEKNIEVKLLKGPTNIGYYFAATDPAPKPGEFKLLNQGMIAVKDLLVAFTILTNDGQDAVVAAALSMLSGAEKQSVHAASPDPGTLQVIENNGAYELSVPISRLVMRIPKENLSPQKNPLGGSASGPRYFCFGDGKALFLSGWFESADDFKGMERFWKGETQSWSEKPKNVSFQQIGNWNIVIYDMEVPLPETSNSHIRAELVQSGTWIDLHLSLTAGQSAKDTRAKLVKILKKILVVER